MKLSMAKMALLSRPGKGKHWPERGETGPWKPTRKAPGPERPWKYVPNLKSLGMRSLSPEYKRK